MCYRYIIYFINNVHPIEKAITELPLELYFPEMNLIVILVYFKAMEL